MSLRKAKQLLESKRQKEKLLQVEEDDDEEIPQTTKPALNPFAFGQQDSSDGEEQTAPPQEHSKTSMPQNKNKNNKKRNKNKSKQIPTNTPNTLDDIEKIIKEAGLSTTATTKTFVPKQQIQEVLAIREGRFNHQRELKKHFKGWRPEQDAEQGPEINRRQQKMMKNMQKMARKGVLSPCIEEFLPTSDVFEVEQTGDMLIVVPTTRSTVQKAEFEVIRNTNDVNALFQFSQRNPMHVEALYALAQFLRLQGNYRDADLLIQRVLHVYQMSLGYKLTQFVTTDHLKTQMAYDQHSKTLFMSLFKFMDILGKKGCYQAALEYNKFLLKINFQDPTACLLCFDYNAISAKEHQFLLSFVQNYGDYIGQSQTSLYGLPNFMYSVALARFYQQTNDGSAENKLITENNIGQLLNFSDENWNEALKFPTNSQFSKQDCKTLLLRAILAYPKVIVDLGERNQYKKQRLENVGLPPALTKPFKQLYEHPFWENAPSSYTYYFLRLETLADSNGLDKMLEVYVERSKILWKSREVLFFVRAALGFVIQKIEEGFDHMAYFEGLVLASERCLKIPFTLRRYERVNKNNFSDRVQRIDLNNIQDNQGHQPRQEPQENWNRVDVNQNGLALFLRSLMPWNNLPAEAGSQQRAPFDPDEAIIESDDDM